MSSSHASGEWTSQLRRGVLELCILRLLSRGPSYGYELVSTLDAYPMLASGENTVYPLLRRLKQEGALETFARESPSGPVRQYYRCTRDGERRLKELEKDWNAMVSDVASFSKEGRR